jgi:hypothetical protein
VARSIGVVPAAFALSAWRFCAVPSIETVMCAVASRWGLTQPKPLPCLAVVEALQREQDLTRLPPKGRLIAAQPVEWTGGQIGRADKGAREIFRWICRLHGR